VFLESSVAAKAEMDVARVATVSMRTSAVFMRVSPFSICLCMKASRDGLALYTMQNRIGGHLFRGWEKNIFWKAGIKQIARGFEQTSYRWCSEQLCRFLSFRTTFMIA
jgi:hypothetical protein